MSLYLRYLVDSIPSALTIFSSTYNSLRSILPNTHDRNLDHEKMKDRYFRPFCDLRSTVFSISRSDQVGGQLILRSVAEYLLADVSIETMWARAARNERRLCLVFSTNFNVRFARDATRIPQTGWSGSGR